MKRRIWSLWNSYEIKYRIELFAGTIDKAEKYRNITLKLNHYFTQL